MKYLKTVFYTLFLFHIKTETLNHKNLKINRLQTQINKSQRIPSLLLSKKIKKLLDIIILNLTLSIGLVGFKIILKIKTSYFENNSQQHKLHSS
ncbi:hypothetical protein GCM10011518_35360 [Flavobacterium limi]|uniref:Uncharacterized protein n=1 Tax=Flavobacterium limi TaxID=2045105 RepID=A0ABQ1UNX7_9FLAO|nr:hypothetical protein GCM10011518_35360 [Flavobacterium limi]